MTWLGTMPAMLAERHFGNRVVRCFADRPKTFNAMLAEAVARNPTGEALICGPQRLDYRGLDVCAGRVAAGLAASGIGRGDRVALLIANSAEFVIALYAILRLGAIAVPLNVREGSRELAYVLCDSTAKALVYHGALAGALPAPSLTPSLVHRIAIDEGLEGDDWRALLHETCETAAAVELAEEETAVILYTSGTTGRPKGAQITHMGLVHAAMIYEGCMGLAADDRSVVSVPLSHVTGLTAGIAAMVRAAGTLIIMPEFRADAFIGLAEAERMTHTVMVPAMYNLCLLSPAFKTAELSNWRIGGYGGAPMPEVSIERLTRRLPRLQLFNAYGSTETTGPVVLMPPREAATRARAVGRAVPPAEILVMDERGLEVGAGDSGEIWLRAPNTVAGYWQNPEATEDAFVAGFWRSGDIGRLDADGFLTLLDRSKDLVNRGGYKIFSVEVENVLAAHPAVIEAAVVARPCPVLGERVHAFVHARDGFCDAEALRLFGAGQLADYKVPETIAFLTEPLPRNAGGKVLKRELRERLAAAASV